MSKPIKPKKPTGYLVKFWHGIQYYPNGTMGKTGCGETVAHSEQQLSKILKRLHTKMDMEAEVVPIWGPIATPCACARCGEQLGYFQPGQAPLLDLWGCITCGTGSIVYTRGSQAESEIDAATRYLALTQS